MSPSHRPIGGVQPLQADPARPLRRRSERELGTSKVDKAEFEMDHL